jgi:hypothetical protein
MGGRSNIEKRKLDTNVYFNSGMHLFDIIDSYVHL